jgi:acyl carrier protein
MSHEQQIIDYITSELVMGRQVSVTAETELISEGVLDSVALVELVVWIEATYGFSVGIEDLTPEAFGTVAKIAGYVRSHTESEELVAAKAL